MFSRKFNYSLNKNWQEQETILISVPIQNCFKQDVNALPTQLLSIVNATNTTTAKYGDYLGTLKLEFDKSSLREKMNIKELMRYCLEGSRIANVRSGYGSPGSTVTVYPETFGGEGYSKEIKARAWGELKGERAILLQVRGENNYILNYNTFKEICYLLSLNLSNCETYQNIPSRGGFPGEKILVPVPGKYISAIAWYAVPPGKLNLFKVHEQWYAISLAVGRTISTERRERRTGSYLNHDPRREIIWHYFDLSGCEYSLPLRLQNTI